MMARLGSLFHGHGTRLWPSLLLLLVAVLTPTAALTWLVGEAAHNERLAARQRSIEGCQASLQSVQRNLEAQLRARLERCERLADGARPEVAARLTATRLADGAALLDERGQVWDSLPGRGEDELLRLEAWNMAVRLEFREQDLRRAAQQFEAIEAASEHPDVKARALQSQARCLCKMGEREKALAIYLRLLQSPAAIYARDPQRRLIAVDAGLRALELMQKAADTTDAIVAARRRMIELLDPERGANAPSSQRRFIGRKLHEMFPGDAAPSWLESEELSAHYVSSRPAPPPPGVLHPTSLPETWQIVSPHSRVVLLYRTATLRRLAHDLIQRAPGDGARSMTILAPGEQVRSTESLALEHVPAMPGWKLAWTGREGSSWDERAGRRIAIYAWTTALAIGAIAATAVLLAVAIRRQQRFQRMQNDWLAAVSHELKTPLTSIILLSEALVEDRAERGDYSRMIYSEAARLMRLIERLLALARHEGGVLDLRSTRPETLAAMACAALGDRLESPDCQFRQELDEDLPDVLVDVDGLTAALVNLLENAWKFTGREKRIVLSVRRDGAGVCFQVGDNGPGLSPSDSRHVFTRFFQADRRLSREHGGCGLGLSIVKQIIELHSGRVSVAARPGQGCVFSLWLPAARAIETRHLKAHHRGASVDGSPAEAVER